MAVDVLGARSVEGLGGGLGGWGGGDKLNYISLSTTDTFLVISAVFPLSLHKGPPFFRVLDLGAR